MQLHQHQIRRDLKVLLMQSVQKESPLVSPRSNRANLRGEPGQPWSRHMLPQLQRKLPVSLSSHHYLPQSIPRSVSQPSLPTSVYSPEASWQGRAGKWNLCVPTHCHVLRMDTWEAQVLHSGKTHTLLLNPFQIPLSTPRHACSPGHHLQFLSIRKTLSAVFISEI